jgi:LmbE family N-acetylglucosaminyl deacetylase
MSRIALEGRIVVVSPHSDDAVFSLAATIARAARAGAQVEILTVFALDPASDAPANGWDTRGGFATEGEAATGRRDEDRAACSVIGATPRWLTFRGGGYTNERAPEDVWSAVHHAVSGAAAVLVPGFPLTNPDHAWLSELLTARPLPCERVGLYAEQPYRYMHRGDSAGPDMAVGQWVRSRPDVAHYRLKRKAIRAYGSQLRLLGLSKRPWSLDVLLLHEALHGGEALSWAREGQPSGS